MAEHMTCAEALEIMRTEESVLSPRYPRAYAVLRALVRVREQFRWPGTVSFDDGLGDALMDLERAEAGA